MAQRIGVEVTSGIRSGPSNTGAPSGVLHVAGLTQHGPTDQAVTIRTVGEYASVFGDRTPYSGPLFDTARMFFEEGGAELLVSRVTGPAATTATVDIDGAGTDAPAVLRISAAEPGAWSNDWTVTVAEADDGSTYSVEITDTAGETLALWRGITELSELVGRAASNQLVKVQTLTQDLEARPLDGEYNLTGGSDDRENVTTAEVIAALERAGREGEGGAVAVPGYPADLIGGVLTDYASRSRKIALLSPHQDAELVEVEQLAGEISDTLDGSRAGLFYPHLVIPDAGATRIVSPEGFVAAVRARAFREGEFWRVPAGLENGRANWITGTTVPVNAELLDRLDASRVNGIQTSGARVWLNNWSSLADDPEHFGLLSSRDTLNNLKVLVKNRLENYVWRTNDGRGFLFGEIESAVVSILHPISQAGGFYAEINSENEEVDPGYTVVVDRSNNPIPQVARNEITVDVAVRLSPVAKLIRVEIVKVAIGAAL